MTYEEYWETEEFKTERNALIDEDDFTKEEATYFLTMIAGLKHNSLLEFDLGEALDKLK